MTEDQAKKVRKARMTFDQWADAEGLTAEQRARLNRADRAAVVPCAMDAMKHEALAAKIAEAQDKIAAWEDAQAEYAYAVDTLAKMKEKALSQPF